MGIYSENTTEDLGLNIDEICEAFLLDDLAHNFNDEMLEEFTAPGGALDAIISEGVFTGKIRKIIDGKELKGKDLHRRQAIIAYMIARSKGAPEWKKLVKLTAMRKALKAKIIAKYGQMAKKGAKKSQQAYVKRMRSVKVGKSFNQSGGAER